MGAFDSINVRAPQDRRRKLAAKLARQRLGGEGGLAAPGRGFRNSFRGVPKVKQTKGKDKLLAQLVASLGGGQNEPLPSEMSDGWGEAVPPPPAPEPPPPPPPPPGGEGDQGEGFGPDMQSAEPAQEPAPTPESAPFIAPVQENTSPNFDPVPLGGGYYFNPITGQTYYFNPHGISEF